MEIANCRWCGNPAQIERDGDYVYVVSRCKHWLQGPSFHTIDEAINMWNEMMYTGIPISAPPPSTGHRDRVDRIAAAILCGQWANHAVRTMQPDEVAEEAMIQIDAIDAALKEREANT